MKRRVIGLATAIAAVMGTLHLSPAAAVTWVQREGCGEVTYGRPTDTPLRGNWDGDDIVDVDDLGVWRSGYFFLGDDYCFPRTGTAFRYGSTTDQPLAGDWDGDEADTVGVRRGNMWYLRNSNTPGTANIALSFGRGSDTALVGDWDGDGVDTIGVWRAGVFHLRSTAGPVSAYQYGRTTDTPIVGDWDGDGVDTIGVKRGQAYYLSNNNRSSATVIGFAGNRDRPLPGKYGTYTSDYSHSRDSLAVVR